MPFGPSLPAWPKTLPGRLVLPDTTLVENLRISALRYPRKDAIVFYDHRLSYGELYRQASAIAGWLTRRAGVRKGDRVLLYMQNCPQFVAAFYGILRADAVVVPVNPMNLAEELAHYIVDAGARTIVMSADLAARAVAANQTLAPTARLEHVLVTRYSDALATASDRSADRDTDQDSDQLKEPDEAQDKNRQQTSKLPDWLTAEHPRVDGAVDWKEALAADLRPAAASATPDDLAVLPYTSGTTGFPKGCRHTHRTVMHNAVGASYWIGAGLHSVVLGVLPMFHVTGMQYGMHSPIFVGATVVILPRWDRAAAGRLIARHRVTHWTSIATMIIDFLADPEVERHDLSSLRHLGGGGATMPEAVAADLYARLGLRYHEGYGLTETVAATHGNPLGGARLQCLGIPSFGTDARIVDPTTFEELAPDTVGEIIVSGPQVFLGYWNNEAATREVFVELAGQRFLRTGDLGRMDVDGYFYLVDRLKRMINASGFKVWPAEVESMLYAHPAIREACVIGCVDAYRGETVKALVVLKAPRVETDVDDGAPANGPYNAPPNGPTADAIIAWAKTRMAAYKCPQIVEFVDALPKSATGKIQWRALQEQESLAALTRRAAP